MACQLNLSPYEKNRYARSYPCYASQCENCGWNEAEQKRRVSRGLVRGSDGLRHMTVSPSVIEEATVSDDTGN